MENKIHMEKTIKSFKTRRLGPEAVNWMLINHLIESSSKLAVVGRA